MSASTAPPIPPKEENDRIPSTLRLGTNLLGLGLGPIGQEERIISSPKMNIKSGPSRHQGPAQLTPLYSTTPPSTPPDLAKNRQKNIITPSKASSSPLSKRANGIAEKYNERSQSSSTVSVSGQSILTITPAPPSPSGTIVTTNTMRTNTKDWSWGGTPDKTKLSSSVSTGSIPTPIKRRASGQLLSGIGKGLGRMSSVMRRNTSEGSSSSDLTSSMNSSKSRSWRKKAKSRAGSIQEEDGGWDTSYGQPALRRDPVPGDEGDEGIGRPFNVEHDLHVSPSLEDLPPAWLQSLRQQGLSEQNLLLIASARKRQASVEHVPLHNLKGSDPPKSMNSLPQSVGGSSIGPPDIGQVRGASSGDKSILTKSSREFLSSSIFDSSSSILPAPSITPSSKLENNSAILHRKFSSEPESDGTGKHDKTGLLTTVPAMMDRRHETVDQPSELLDLGGGRRRTPKKNKRMSDQLRCFSQFDIGGEEGWAANLLNAMIAENSTSTSDNTSTPSYTTSLRTAWEPTSDATTLSSPPVTPLTADLIAPRTPEKAIKRVPIPPLLAACPTIDSPLKIGDIGDHSTAVLSRISPSSERHPINIGDANSDSSGSALPRGVETPNRRSHHSFGVNHSHNQSRSSVDLDLITPSHSHDHGHNPSRRSSESEEELEHAVDERSDLNFGDVLKETLYDHTPESTVSDRLRDFLPPVPSFNDLEQITSRETPRRGARFSHPNPAYSVPASISSSLPSRSSTPDRVYHTPERTFLSLPDSTDTSSPTTPVGRANLEERASMALSILSSDSGSHLHDSLHSATLHTAYTKILNQIRYEEEARKRESGGMVGPIAEESEIGDSGSEAGFSALDALEEAARLVSIGD